MNAAGCAGFGHWGDTAYMVQYVGENSPGFFMNNELAHLHNLASVFSERLDTPQTLLLAGESYRSVYAEQSNTSSSETPLQPDHSAPPPTFHLYPMRRTVTIRMGLVGSSSIFARRRRI